MARLGRLFVPLLLVVSTTTGRLALATTSNPLDDAVALLNEGRSQEARSALRALLPGLRAAGDPDALARALSALTEASIATGDYDAAIPLAQEAFELHKQLDQHGDLAWDLNAVGLANLYLGRYDAALTSYERALALDRAGGDGHGEVTRLNNIGNVHYMRGRYADALRLYDEALGRVEGASADVRERLRKMTIANLAVLHQRLGAFQRALDLYGQMQTGEVMEPSEEAQLLANQGTLLRRLGDPIKALQTYRQAQSLFARAGHSDGEIGTWRNIGIAYALDLGDSARALEAFDIALKLARQSSNRRAEVLALLYRGETLRRDGLGSEASGSFQAALAGARALGLVEEEWKALYGLGRIAEVDGPREDAARSYEQALAAIESVRADLQAVPLRSEFLADKRDVYDALIALRLSEPSASPAEVFSLIEQSRARAWQDRLQPEAERLSLESVQRKIAPGALLLEYWCGATSSAVVWVSASAAGIARQAASASDLAAVQQFADAVSRPGEDWRTASQRAGRILLSGLPDFSGVSRLLVVSDGPVHSVPFDALTAPGSPDLLVDQIEIVYLPSAVLLVRSQPAPATTVLWPWQKLLLAFGDPPVAPSTGEIPPAHLSHADDEVRAIAALLPGRAELHVGRDAQKRILWRETPSVPLLHFATHAIADTRDPDRSRILLAPAATGDAADHLFLREIYDLDLRGVQLVTLSACETERGKVIRGEGVAGFSRALLAAGASSAVTTRWDVVDRASAEFMKLFYYALAEGRSEASALREAKRQFLHSQLAWSHPRYWAGYVLSGDGSNRLPWVVSWSGFVAVPSLAVLSAAVYRRFRRRR